MSHEELLHKQSLIVIKFLREMKAYNPDEPLLDVAIETVSDLLCYVPVKTTAGEKWYMGKVGEPQNFAFSLEAEGVCDNKSV